MLLTAVTAFAGMAGVSFAAQMSSTRDVADVEHNFALPPSLRGAVVELSRASSELSGILNARLEPTSEPITFEPLPREEEEGAVDEDDDAVELDETPSFAEKPPLPAALPAANATAATATATAAAGASQAPPTNVPQDKTSVSPNETVERRLSETANILESTTTEQPDGGIVNWPWSISGRRPPRRAAPAPT